MVFVLETDLLEQHSVASIVRICQNELPKINISKPEKKALTFLCIFALNLKEKINVWLCEKAIGFKIKKENDSCWLWFGWSDQTIRQLLNNYRVGQSLYEIKAQCTAEL